jgi:hypothetical protein
MTRYNQLLETIDGVKPQIIAEIGVWNGENAARMIAQALKYHDSISYIGFDLFEDANKETDEKEFNVKPHFTKASVETKLKELFPTCEIILYKGDTNKTIPICGISADLCFIDGGHSVETIESDWDRCQFSKVIVLDDYYSTDENGNCPDLTKYGCNQLVERLRDYTLMPKRDPVKGGGFTQFVLMAGR